MHEGSLANRREGFTLNLYNYRNFGVHISKCWWGVREHWQLSFSVTFSWNVKWKECGICALTIARSQSYFSLLNMDKGRVLGAHKTWSMEFTFHTQYWFFLTWLSSADRNFVKPLLPTISRLRRRANKKLWHTRKLNGPKHDADKSYDQYSSTILFIRLPISFSPILYV